MLSYPTAADPATAKALGAFYTDAEIADFLARWAIRQPTDLVVDPSFGGGVFLRSACRRIIELGGQPKDSVHGVEIDPGVHQEIVSRLHDEFGVRRSNLHRTDFFAIDRERFPRFEAVIGNPPFIRFHHFKGAARVQGLRRCAELGLELSELTSSWAPFLAHSTSLIRPGGRLAMVIPMELTYASYAKPLVSFLSREFRKVFLLTFQKRLFPAISEDTLLLLAVDKGKEFEGFFHADLPNAGSLRTFNHEGWARLEFDENRPALKLGLEFVDEATRETYQELKRSGRHELGRCCAVGIGYVTGGNDFFHLSPVEAHKWSIPRRFLKPAVLNAKAFGGTQFRNGDLKGALASKSAAFLLSIPPKEDPRAVEGYLRQGEKAGISRSFKCRSRAPWYSVPNVYRADCFLSYMSGASSRMVANSTGAVAPNTLHVVRIKSPTISGRLLSAAWITTLAQLSAELEGHSLGGGMLKLEPREAAATLVPLPTLSRSEESRLADRVDILVRQGDMVGAQELADCVLLRQGLGISRRSVDGMRAALGALKDRRMNGKKKALPC